MSEAHRRPSVFDFSDMAAEYDEWYESMEGSRYDKLEKRAMLRVLGEVKEGDTLLEIGSGTGWWSLFFSELGFRVTGIDISPKMVDVARSKRIPGSTFTVADAHELPFSDASFSAAAAITTIEFTQWPERAISEMVRCTVRPSGHLFLGVLHASAPVNRDRAINPESLFVSAHFFTVDELYELLAPHGRTILGVSAFPFSLKLPPQLAYWADDLGDLMKWKTGAFIAARVKL
jgi:ubiquinone/menaquinone biosynthesis C-methylase UbiE